MPRLFALDQNFPQPLVQVVEPFIPEVELIPIRTIDVRLADMEDWQILLALHHHDRPWDGLVTTDSSMLKQAKELAVLMQTNLTLVVAHDAGHDPIKATGLLLAHLDYVSAHSTPEAAQVWRLTANNRPAADPWSYLEGIARHRPESAEDLWREAQLTRGEVRTDPLAD